MYKSLCWGPSQFCRFCRLQGLLWSSSIKGCVCCNCVSWEEFYPDKLKSGCFNQLDHRTLTLGEYNQNKLHVYQSSKPLFQVTLSILRKRFWGIVGNYTPCIWSMGGILSSGCRSQIPSFHYSGIPTLFPLNILRMNWWNLNFAYALILTESRLGLLGVNL